MHPTIRNTSAALLLAALLGGCASTPGNWSRPLPPANWSVESAAIKNPEAWWKNFHDPQLDALVEQTLTQNNDFAAAVLRVRRAQLLADLTGTNVMPSVSVGLSTTGTRSVDPVTTTHQSGLSAALSYEVDLWGRLKTQRDASRWEAEASGADCAAFGASLVATTAKLYWQLGYLNRLLAMTDVEVDYARRTLTVAQAKHGAGALSGLSTTQAELNLSTQLAARTQLVQQRNETRNALAILHGKMPASPVAEPATLPDGPLPAIGAGLPAEMLARRPDLESAEYRLRESLAGVDIARTSFYPTLPLTGTLGTSSSALVNLLQNPVATLGAGLVLPFIQWNTAKITRRVAENQFEEAVVLFRQRLLVALTEVENGLSARTQLGLEEETLTQSVAQARRAESIARSRFEAGATELQLWLDAQARVRAVERSLLANRLNQFDNTVDLYRALGLGIAAGRQQCGRSA